jgi:hypothetical protein
MKNPKRKNLYFLYGLILLFTVLMMLLGWDNRAIWQDEVFTLRLIRLPYWDGILATANDVHPPLYYLLLKLFVSLLTACGIDTITAAKIFSVLPVSLLMVLAGRKLLKRYGFETALLFVILLFGTQIIRFAVEIRMYSLAILFVTMAYLYADEIRHEDTRKNWTGLTVCTLLGAYTHYDAVVAISLVYLYLLVRGIRSGTWKKCLASAGAAVLGYLPWLFVIVHQVQTVPADASYDMTLTRLARYAVWPFSTSCLPLTILIAGVSALLAVGSLFHKPLDRLAVLAELNPLYMTGVGILMALATGKFYTGKYILPGWGAFWLGIALAWKDDRRRKQIIALFLVLNSLTYWFVYREEDRDRTGYRQLQEFMATNKGAGFAADGALADILDYYDFGAVREEENGCPAASAYRLVYTEYTSVDPAVYETVEQFQLGGEDVSILKCRQ